MADWDGDGDLDLILPRGRLDFQLNTVENCPFVAKWGRILKDLGGCVTLILRLRMAQNRN